METEAAAQESLGLGKLGTQAEKDRRLKKKWVLFLCDFLAEILSRYLDFYCFTQMWNEKQDHLWHFSSEVSFQCKILKLPIKYREKYSESVNCTILFHLWKNIGLWETFFHFTLSLILCFLPSVQFFKNRHIFNDSLCRFSFSKGWKSFFALSSEQSVISVSRCQRSPINPSSFTFFLPVSKYRQKAN